MKVIFNTYPVAFQCPGGGEIQLLKSMESLQKKGVDVIRFDPWSTRLVDADIVHYFSVQGGSMNFCGFVKSQNLPLIISPIIWLGDNPEIYPVHEINDLLQVADRICPNSIAEQQQLSEYFKIPTEKFTVTHNGIDTIFTSPVEAESFREKYNIGTPFLLCVGNIEPRKNQLNLIRAAKQLNKQLVLIGEIRDKEYYQQCVNEGYDKLTYLGYMDHHDILLRSAYAACELFILPSTLETPGLAALEAYALGCKIAITKHGCTQEYFGNNVVYLDPYSVESIVNAIQSSEDRPADKHTTYLWDNVADELINAYETCLSNR